MQLVDTPNKVPSSGVRTKNKTTTTKVSDEDKEVENLLNSLKV
jgi:hypothetical protein